MRYLRFFAIPIVMVVASVSLMAADSGNNSKGDPFIVGFIFNANNLLLDMDPYHGGVGVKLLFPSFAIRASIGGSYEGSSDTLGLSAFFAYESPFLTGRVNPYWGGGTGFEYSLERTEVDIDNWNQVIGFTGTVGALLGVEFFIFDSLSVFAEYELAGSASWSNSRQNIGGSITDASVINYLFSTGLGNKGSLGVVIYFKPTGNLTQQEQPQPQPKKK